MRLESIGAVTKRLAAVPRGNVELNVSDDCPETEQLSDPYPEANAD
ncbi:MAG: DUF6679 family protein [Nodosilinea sp.]